MEQSYSIRTILHPEGIIYAILDDKEKPIFFSKNFAEIFKLLPPIDIIKRFDQALNNPTGQTELEIQNDRSTPPEPQTMRSSVAIALLNTIVSPDEELSHKATQMTDEKEKNKAVLLRILAKFIEKNDSDIRKTSLTVDNSRYNTYFSDFCQWLATFIIAPTTLKTPLLKNIKSRFG